MEAAGAYNASRVVDVHFRAGRTRRFSLFSLSRYFIFALHPLLSLHHTRQFFFSFFSFFFLFSNQLSSSFPLSASCSHAQPPLGSIFRLLTGTELPSPFVSSPGIVTSFFHRGCDSSAFSIRSERVICDIYLSWLDLKRPFDVTRPDAVQLATFT